MTENNSNENSLMGQLIDMAKRKYEPSLSESDKLFWEILEYDIKCHMEGKEKNKKKYFNENKKVMGLGPLLKAVKGSWEPLKLILCIPVILYSLGISWLTNMFQKNLENKPVLIGIMLVASIIFCLLFGSYVYKIEKKRLNLGLRRYGNTWVRHSSAFAELKEELLRFVCQLPPYDGLDIAMQRINFKERIINIQRKNQEQFETNMKYIE